MLGFPAVLLVLGGCAASGDHAAVCPERSIDAYTLGAGDQIRLVVFRHEDLSGEFQVDGSGYVALPLLGETLAGGLTTRQLEDEIEAQLIAQGFLMRPQSSVEVLTYRDFYIIGEVNSPAGYPYQNGARVVNAVALAGGYTYRADQGGVMVRADGLECEADANTPILPGDVVEVPERFF